MDSFVDYCEKLMPNDWSYPLVMGMMLSKTRSYLRGDISRAAFTGWFAQVQMMWDHYSTSIAFAGSEPRDCMAAAIEASRAAAGPPELPAAPAGD